MGKGSDRSPAWKGKDVLASTLRKKATVKFEGLVQDLECLRAMWIRGPSQRHDDHKQRLDAFYERQANAYDRFREAFLWGRKLMLAACARRLEDCEGGLIWVDIGGGTGENVQFMSEHTSLDRFKAIYVVDLCGPLCDVAHAKVQEKRWKNVHVIQEDACRFRVPEGSAHLITFSYSLSMIPSFHEAIDRTLAYLSEDGLVGFTDFFVSSKHDIPCRQMNWLSRWFWRSIFDLDSVDIGPERRQYMETKLCRLYEYNGQGTIPYVPRAMKAPYFVWVGTKSGVAPVELEMPKRTPPSFPSTFIYSVSWEDPRADAPVLKVGPGDVVLTFTSGGCNSLHMIAQGADAVYSVDVNPAQSALLELKCLAVKHLPYEDVWMMFGEGHHVDFKSLLDKQLAPFMTQGAYNFWKKRTSYFCQGLYYQGSMGKVILFLYWFQRLLGIRGHIERMCGAQSMEEQQELFDAIPLVKFIRRCPSCMKFALRLFFSWILLNPAICWLGLGVPKSQRNLIARDRRTVTEYACTSIKGVVQNSLLSKENYFYLLCLLGHFTRECCPAFLKPEVFDSLKQDGLNNIHIRTSTFLEELRKRKYTKIILMDHVDWAWQTGYVQELAVALQQHVLPGGVIIFRSASVKPPYAEVFSKHGFEVRCVSRITDESTNGYIDRVNMYSSFWEGRRT